MQRRTACFPETPPESQQADDQSESACYMRRWVTENFAPHFGGKHLHLHQQSSPLHVTGCGSVTEVPRRLSTGRCTGEMSTVGVCFFFWCVLKHLGDQAAPGLLWANCLETALQWLWWQPVLWKWVWSSQSSYRTSPAVSLHFDRLHFLCKSLF